MPAPWVGCFGGEVWPGAWPELFKSPPQNNYGCGPNTLTDLGFALFTKAITDLEPERWYDILVNGRPVETIMAVSPEAALAKANCTEVQAARKTDVAVGLKPTISAAARLQ